MEKLVKYRRSRISYIHNYILVLLLLAFLYLLFPYVHLENLVWMAAVGIISLISLALILEPEYERSYRYYQIEENELSMVEGIFSKKKLSLMYENITDILVSRTVRGRVLNFGDLTVTGIRNDILIRGIRNPNKIYKYIREKIPTNKLKSEKEREKA